MIKLNRHQIKLVTIYVITFLIAIFCRTGLSQELKTIAQIDAKYQRLSTTIQASSDVPEELNSILKVTGSSIQDLKLLQQEIDRLNALASTPLMDEKELSKSIEKLKAKYPLPDKKADISTIRTRLTQYQSLRDTSQASLTLMKSQLSNLVQRSETILPELVNARESLNGIFPSKSTANDLDSTLDEARVLFNQAALLKSTFKVKVLERELATLPLRQTQLNERIKLEKNRLNVLTIVTMSIQSELRQSDLREAQQLVGDIEERIEQSTKLGNEELLIEQKKNLVLAKKLIASYKSYYLEERLVQSTVDQNSEIDSSLRLLDRIISAGRADGDLGAILRRIRGELVSPIQISREEERLRSLQVSLQLDSILFQDGLDTTQLKVQKNNLSTGLIIEEQQNILQLLIGVTTKLDNTLNGRLAALEKLNSKSKQLRRELNGRLLWLPTNQALNTNWLPQTASALVSFISLDAWQRVLEDFQSELQRNTLLASLLFLLSIGLLLYRKKLLTKLHALPKRVRNVSLDAHWVSPYALLLSIVLALTLPLIFWTIGWLLSTSHDPFTHAISVSFFATADVMFLFSLFGALARPNGIIGGHFRWNENARKILLSNLSWLMMVIIPTSFLFVYALTIGNPESQYSLGRTVFLLISFAISFASYRILKSGNHVIEHMFDRVEMKFLGQIIFFIFTVIPLLLGLLTLVGYFDTSVILQSKVFFSGLIILCGALIYGFMHRTQEVSSRRDALKRAKVRRAARLEKLTQETTQEESGESLSMFESEEFANLDEINKQTNTVIWLTTFATVVTWLYFLWKSVFPALDITESVVLWQGVKMIDGVATSQPIDLGDLINALILIFGGFFLAKNLRGILALGISQKFNILPGTEYAATTILGYIAVAVGVSLGLSQLGLDWGKLQWIVAAMGVGLGFGLQEIVANFVSGLIILFERPIRVGDTVTIGNLDGVVTKISIRATTIKDFEKRDVLIPNKKVITDDVSNWTLNDSVTRLLIKIGVSYDSDIALVKRLMTDIVTSHPNVLKEPAPSVYFVNHGNSTLDFEIRSYVSEISQRLITKHEINEGINTALNNAGVDIAYPQQDIHIKSFVDHNKANLKADNG